jgi:hypothetical protein
MLHAQYQTTSFAEAKGERKRFAYRVNASTMKEIVMSKKNIISRLIEIKGRSDRAAERLARLKSIPLAVRTEKLNNNIIESILTRLVEANVDLTAMHSEVTAMRSEVTAMHCRLTAMHSQLTTAAVTELAATIERLALEVSLGDFEEAADPLPGVMDDDESTADEGGAP